MITKGRKPTKVTSGEPNAKTKELEIQPRLGSLVHFSRLTTHDASKKPTGSEEFGVEAFQALSLSLSLWILEGQQVGDESISMFALRVYDVKHALNQYLNIPISILICLHMGYMHAQA